MMISVLEILPYMIAMAGVPVLWAIVSSVGNNDSKLSKGDE